MDICPKCGLPKQACVCDEISKSGQRIKVTTDKRQYGKLTTIVEGFGEGVDIKATGKALKNELACGGTVKNNTVELQGDHRKNIKKALEKVGFEEATIEN